MSPDPPRDATSRTLPRRRLLAAVGVAAVAPTAGCSAIDASSGPEGEGDTREIVVVNETEAAAEIAVRVADRDGETLFSRVYDLDAGHTDESAGIEARPATVTAFTPDGTSRTWTYDPDVDLDCEGVDVGVRLTREGTVEAWYAC